MVFVVQTSLSILIAQLRYAKEYQMCWHYGLKNRRTTSDEKKARKILFEKAMHLKGSLIQGFAHGFTHHHQVFDRRVEARHIQ